ncbi:Haem-binding domain-containing protein [Daejeonella rubra]|uniref:Haem-binding domain-containing protein n=1 Tax=Daejeonella rubra TaxID=990371 RepID=A0A1G9SDK4_9SPHI|nr:heme-binding domain-containing protein [Daejeonella rubra]SDM33472.1 Haem-binding domain-containing protein [Daejeonella rubra]
MSITKKILIALLGVLIIIQFIKPAKNQSSAPSPNDIFANFQASDSTKQLIRTSCYDCHSNNTVYPWYAEIQPVAWWLADHVNKAKSELNFSEFASYTPKKADHKLEEVIEVIQEGEMPLKSYTLIHGNAKLSEAQKTEIITWAKELRNQIKPNIK